MIIFCSFKHLDGKRYSKQSLYTKTKKKKVIRSRNCVTLDKLNAQSKTANCVNHTKGNVKPQHILCILASFRDQLKLEPHPDKT